MLCFIQVLQQTNSLGYYNTVISVGYNGEKEDKEEPNCALFHFNYLLFEQQNVAPDLLLLKEYAEKAPAGYRINLTLYKNDAFTKPGNDRVLHISCNITKENIDNIKEYNIDGFTMSVNALLKEAVYALLK